METKLTTEKLNYSNTHFFNEMKVKLLINVERFIYDNQYNLLLIMLNYYEFSIIRYKTLPNVVEYFHYSMFIMI